MTTHITHDSTYDTIAPEDFDSLIDVTRYGRRSGAFDEMIAQSEQHFWDPGDPAYIDFSHDFDLRDDTVMPLDFPLELNCAVRDRLTARQQIELANEITRFNVSQLLHGEQGALSLSVSLCQTLVDPGAQEFAANQAREEARHVAAFSTYVRRRWGTPIAAGATLGALLNELVRAPEVYKKIVGMQMLVEGLAMGAFATLHVQTRDPVLRRVVQLVMTDEAFHHRFGRIWAKRTVPKMTQAEHDIVEDWAAACFQRIFTNLVSPEQKAQLYTPFGLDWRWVQSAVMEAFGDEHRRDMMRNSAHLFRVLVKTLLHGGIITTRTEHVYAPWVDLGQLGREPEGVVGDDVAEGAMAELREINRTHRKRMGRVFRRSP